VPFLETNDVAPVIRLERDRAVGRGSPRVELARLRDGSSGQLGAGDPAGEAEIVLDPPRRPGLAAERGALDHERVQTLRRAVDGCAEAGWATADDGEVDFFPRRELAPDAKGTRHLADRRCVQLAAAGKPDEQLSTAGRADVVPRVRQVTRPSEVDHAHRRLRRMQADDLHADAVELLQGLASLHQRCEHQVAERAVLEEQLP